MPLFTSLVDVRLRFIDEVSTAKAEERQIVQANPPAPAVCCFCVHFVGTLTDLRLMSIGSLSSGDAALPRESDISMGQGRILLMGDRQLAIPSN